MTLGRTVQEFQLRLLESGGKVPLDALRRPVGAGLPLWLDATFGAFSADPSGDLEGLSELRRLVLERAAVVGSDVGSAELALRLTERIRGAATVAASAYGSGGAPEPIDLADHLLHLSYKQLGARGYRRDWPVPEPQVLSQCPWQRTLPILLALEQAHDPQVPVRGMVAQLKLWCIDSGRHAGNLAFVPAPASYLVHLDPVFQAGLAQVREFLLARLERARVDVSKLALVYDLRQFPGAGRQEGFPEAVYGASASASFALGALHVLRAYLDDDTRFALEYLVDWSHLAVSATVEDAEGRLGPVYYLQEKAEAWNQHAALQAHHSKAPILVSESPLAQTPLSAARAATVDDLLQLAGEHHGHCTREERRLLRRMQPPGKPGHAAQAAAIGTAEGDLALLRAVAGKREVTHLPSVQSYLLRRYAACALGQAGVLTEVPMRLDLHFVNLTLGAEGGNEPGVARDYDDLPSLLRRFEAPADDETRLAPPAAWLVRGDPGAGKTTLLRHYMMQSARAALLAWTGDPLDPAEAAPAPEPSQPDRQPELCIELRVADFPAAWPDQGGFEAWLGRHLQKELPRLETLRHTWRLRFVIDAVNETAVSSPDRHHALMTGLRETLARWAKADGPRARPDLPTLFSIRTLESSRVLQSADYPVRDVVVRRWSLPQMQRYCRLHGERCEPLARQLEALPQSQPRLFELLQLPLNLAIQVELLLGGAMTGLANSRAELFNTLLWVRLGAERKRMLAGAIPSGAAVAQVRQAFAPAEERVIDRLGLLGVDDRARWLRTRPRPGGLVRNLMALGQAAQARRASSLGTEQAMRLLGLDGADMDRLIEQAGGLHILQPSADERSLYFVHQNLWQEFLAALQLLEHEPGAWPVDERRPAAWWPQRYQPDLPDPSTIPADRDLLPFDPPSWEEPVKLALELALHTHQDDGPPVVAKAWLDWLMHDDATLAWAGRAAGPVREVLDRHFKPTMDELRRRLRTRSGQGKLDLRLRVEAGLALGLVGDPRYVGRSSPCRTLVPDDAHWVRMPAKEYTIGAPQTEVNDRTAWADESPRTPVHLEAFQLAWAPVTNAEFACFIEDRGYGSDDRAPDWWGGAAASRWWAGDNEDRGGVSWWQARREEARTVADAAAHFAGYTPQFQRRTLPWLQTVTDAEFERWLQQEFSAGRWREPAYWDDAAFNNPAQPVVGVSLYEARAYCRWLTERRGRDEGWIYQLPLEAEVEAVAQLRVAAQLPAAGLGWCNNDESRLGRTSPVGVFPDSHRHDAQGRPAADLSGNAWVWTVSRYTPRLEASALQQPEDEFEPGVARVVRSGAWSGTRQWCRASYRDHVLPLVRNSGLGFRLVRRPMLGP